ncbi:hypothetical protein BX600DRAFT_266905 [Xylariales sp. PMI_506]|nr:hypothetical protein BX600DRAFT_266905 [Xylariales sp. PMI_506]
MIAVHKRPSYCAVDRKSVSHLGLPINPPSLNVVAGCLAFGYIIFGTVTFSSLQFVSLTDPQLLILWWLVLPTVVCRLIIMME